MSVFLGWLVLILLFSLPAFMLGLSYGIRKADTILFPEMLAKLSQEEFDDVVEKAKRIRQVSAWKDITNN